MFSDRFILFTYLVNVNLKIFFLHSDCWGDSQFCCLCICSCNSCNSLGSFEHYFQVFNILASHSLIQNKIFTPFFFFFYLVVISYCIFCVLQHKKFSFHRNSKFLVHASFYTSIFPLAYRSIFIAMALIFYLSNYIKILLCSAVLAHFILAEKLHIFGVLGCILCMVGSTSIVLHAPQERIITSVKQVWHLATEPGIYLISVILLIWLLWLSLKLAFAFALLTMVDISRYLSLCCLKSWQSSNYLFVMNYSSHYFFSLFLLVKLFCVLFISG